MTQKTTFPVKILWAVVFLLAGSLAGGCGGQPEAAAFVPLEAAPTETPTPAPSPGPTPFPTRPAYLPGELVAYTAQTGDTLPQLAARFQTTVAEILAANTFIPADASTMPPGMPMQIPIYYLPFWGTPFQIIPDSVFVNGPSQVGFDAAAFVDTHYGWLSNYQEYAAGQTRTGAELVQYVARNFSISPQLLLALLEDQLGAVTDPARPENLEAFPLGYENSNNRGLYLQLVWAANKLNDGYYRWRSGDLLTLELLDGRLEHPDPWQNAATVALQRYFSEMYPPDRYAGAVGPEGFARTFVRLFGDPWETAEPHIPGSLRQPTLRLPFEARRTWALTGGPHTGWGKGAPLAALDFAPPSAVTGCVPSREWATAVADGVVTRSETGMVVLDLDGDGEERTGWVIFYLHLATEGRAPLGAVLRAGDLIGHPSCEGGTSTGSHIHIARKFNGEWMLAEGVLAFDLEGWVAYNGDKVYEGELKKFSRAVVACTCANAESHIRREGE